MPDPPGTQDFRLLRAGQPSWLAKNAATSGTGFIRRQNGPGSRMSSLSFRGDANSPAADGTLTRPTSRPADAVVNGLTVTDASPGALPHEASARSTAATRSARSPQADSTLPYLVPAVMTVTGCAASVAESSVATTAGSSVS